MKQACEILDCSAEFKERLALCARYGMAKIKTLELWEFGLFKLCLVCFGAWLATAFSKVMKKFKHLFFFTFLISCIYFIWRIFLDTEE